MKKLSLIVACLTALAFVSALGQQAAPSPSQAPASESKPALIKFDLDFHGGTPAELVAAIQTATGRTLNAIVPSESAYVKLPPLKMKNVDVNELFRALLLASHHRNMHAMAQGGAVKGGPPVDLFCGFRTDGPVTDDSIWYFHNDGIFPAVVGQSVRFYPLGAYLERSITVDDIIGAAQDAWKMLGLRTMPATHYNEKTKLLIAVGRGSQLDVIDNVLKALKR